MAKVIEFYAPEKFRKQGERWVPPEQRGKIIPFPAADKLPLVVITGEALVIVVRPEPCNGVL